MTEQPAVQTTKSPLARWLAQVLEDGKIFKKEVWTALLKASSIDQLCWMTDQAIPTQLQLQTIEEVLNDHSSMVANALLQEMHRLLLIKIEAISPLHKGMKKKKYPMITHFGHYVYVDSERMYEVLTLLSPISLEQRIEKLRIAIAEYKASERSNK